MKCLDDHHHYELSSFEHPNVVQDLKFINKKPTADDPTKLETVHDGTTNEEVLKALIHRLKDLNDKFPCRENSIATTHIETALLWLEYRTANRIARNVEGKHIA